MEESSLFAPKLFYPYPAHILSQLIFCSQQYNIF